jgi:hypothetical protein
MGGSQNEVSKGRNPMTTYAETHWVKKNGMVVARKGNYDDAVKEASKHAQLDPRASIEITTQRLEEETKTFRPFMPLPRGDNDERGSQH